MVYAQTNSLSSTEGRLLNGEKGLAYWCMPAILHSISLHSLFSPFCYFDSFPTPILSAYLCSVMRKVVL